MGIPVFISEASITWVIRRASEGKFVNGLDNNKTSPWNDIVNKTMFNSTKKGKYSELSMKIKMLLKIQNENLLPKGGGGDQPTLDHRVFLHFFLTKQKANVPKYIFRHMIKTLKENQTIKRIWIPYGRLISEILHQGGILNALKEVNYFTDAQLGTVTGKIINGSTLKHMKLIKKEDYKVLSTDLKESTVLSNLMDDFPPICKQDPIEVQVMYMVDHFERTGQTIKISDIHETMYGGALPIAKSRKSKKRAMTEVEYVEDDLEKASKKAKKSKVDASQANTCDTEVLTIQQEAQELDASEVLDKRTRSKKPADTAQSSKKRKMAIKKLRQASLTAEDEQEEAVTSLVTREALKKKALELATQISVPANVQLKKTTSEDARVAIALSEDLQQLVVSGELLKDAEKIAAGSEAVTSKAAASRGNLDVSNSINIIEVESGSETSISSPDSSDIDDVPLNLLYKNISPSTKQQQQVNAKPFEPVYPAVLKSIREMSQKRIDTCNKLPIDHPLQPPMVEPLNVAPADAEGSDEAAGSASATIATSSQTQTQTETCEPSNSQPKSPTKQPEPNVLDQLVSHYSGELPEVESELQKASEVASDEVASKSPQQQQAEPQIALTKIQIIPDYIESTSCTEEVSEPEATKMEIDITNSFFTSAFDDMTETNIPTTISTQLTNNQPSSSHLAIQPITPAKPNKIPFPPTLYLDSTLLIDVCNNIF